MAQRREVIKDPSVASLERRVIEGGQWGAQRVRDLSEVSAKPRDTSCPGSQTR